MSEVVMNVGFYDDDYIFMPACCYNGNRFDVLKKSYPPMYTPDEASPNMQTVITNVPRLNKDGSGIIEVTTGDVSTPCIGVFSQTRKKGFLLFTVQEIDGKNLGLAYENGNMIITYPAKRKELYAFAPPRFEPYEGEYISLDAEIPYRFLEFDCPDVEYFFKTFFENRKIMGMDCTLPKVLSKEEQLKIQFDKFNDNNWYEEGQFYASGLKNTNHYTWQPGWAGDAMNTYAFLKLGGKTEKERAMKTLYHLFKFQEKSGFFQNCDINLVPYSDAFGVPGTDNWCSVRKSADILYFVLRQFELMEFIPESFENGIKRCADAFVRIWKENGQLGQFIDIKTLDIVAGSSAGGGIAPAGLVWAYKHFKEEEYMNAAEEIADYYYVNFIKKGYTTGGPGEILQCPDSESAFALLESYVCLYEETGKQKYLDYAQTTAYLCSSWVVSYNYKFPNDSEFGRLDMKTIGSVFANVQNKHSAPGICTLSGTSLRKLYEWTKNEKFLELFTEITETISQYMSTDERPIYTFDKKKLPSGCICERVNMSDWERHWCNVGGVFFASCWCETSNLLVLAEM